MHKMSGRKLTSHLVVVLMVTCCLVVSTPLVDSTIYGGETAGGFQAGIFYITPQGRLKLPQGSALVLGSSLSILMSQDLAEPLSTSVGITVPFKFDLDLLGLTDLNNDWGSLTRKTRDASVQDTHPGGDRSHVYRLAENSLRSAGVDGRACLTRAICEINLDFRAPELGLLGEVFHLMLSPSKSTHSMGDYTVAEEEGRTTRNCTRYHSACPYSFFYDGQTTEGYQSGLVYITQQGRLKMPQGSVFLLVPTLSVPMSQDLPEDSNANLAISAPFKFDLDLLGLTDVSNDWGSLTRKTRDASVQDTHPGGDRSHVYRLAENSLRSAGVDGRACLTRAICEINLDFRAPELGLLGEVFHLMLSPSKSSHSMGDYTVAEEEGKTTRNCTRYHSACPYSFFYDQE